MTGSVWSGRLGQRKFKKMAKLVHLHKYCAKLKSKHHPLGFVARLSDPFANLLNIKYQIKLLRFAMKIAVSQEVINHVTIVGA